MKKSFNVTIVNMAKSKKPNKSILEFIEEPKVTQEVATPVEGEAETIVDGINKEGEVVAPLTPAVVEVITEQPKVKKEVDQLYAHNLACLADITDITKRVLDLLINTSPEGMFMPITDNLSIQTFNSSMNEIIISKLQSKLGVTSL